MVGPLATYAEPHCYDLCQMHSDRLTAPRGWEVVRITPDPEALKPTTDDLEALANAVREAARPRHDIPPVEIPSGDRESTDQSSEVGRRSHLRVVPDVSSVDFEQRTGASEQRRDDVDDDHPVFTSQTNEPGPGLSSTGHEPTHRISESDKPFDHERLW